MRFDVHVDLWVNLALLSRKSNRHSTWIVYIDSNALVVPASFVQAVILLHSIRFNSTIQSEI